MKKKKYKSVKLSSDALRAIWDASRPSVQRNKKKYTRKSKHRGGALLEEKLFINL